MSRRVRYIIVVLILAAAILIVWRLISKSRRPSGTMPAAPVVEIQVAEVRDVEDYYDFTGNTAAVEQVEIRARVEGFLTSLNFTDGQDVNAGDVLFTIEPNEFTDARDQARSQLMSSNAELASTQIDYERTEKAARTNAVSEQALTTAKANRDKAEAQVMSATAALSNANLNLSYTRVESPITGRVSRRFVDPGNLVGASEQTLLATVVKIRPMYVYFNVSEEILEQYYIRHSPAELKARKPEFRIGFAQQEGYPYEGFLDYIDTRVDPTTGTIVFRGQVPNTEGLLVPGMFVRVRVPVGIRHNAVLVEDKALNSDIGGKYVLVLDANDTAHISYVKIGREVGDMRVIYSGITDKQRYIVSGFHAVRAGSRVRPQFEDAADTRKP
jgi:RND family efflux transporter MFP subunit